MVTRGVSAYYYDGKTAQRYLVSLTLNPRGIVLSNPAFLREVGYTESRISEPLGHAPRSIHFNDGSYCEINDTLTFAAMLKASGYRDSISVRLHSRWSWVIGASFAINAFAIATYLWFLPLAATLIAPHVPTAFTEHISKSSLTLFDSHLLKPSALSAERQSLIQEKMAGLAAANPNLPSYHLNFRSAPGLPPNAFALPNGDIVVFDNLAKALNDDEIIAVLSHELGHVAKQHGLRMLIQGAVVSTVAAVYLGDISSAVAALSTALLESNYSQTFETEADDYGATTLQRAGQSPALLASALGKLAPVPKDEAGWRAWFSSHPATQKRIATLRAMH